MDWGNIQGLIHETEQVVFDSGEIDTAVSSITIPNLDGDNDEEYLLICRFIDDATVGDYKLTFNSDTGANYGYQDMKGIGSVASAVRDTSESYWHIGESATDDYLCFSETKIFAKSGQVRTGITKYAYDISGTTVTGIVLRGQSWNNAVDNITQMVITASADKINVGSRIILLRKVKVVGGMRTGVINIKGSVLVNGVTNRKGIVKGQWQTIYKNTLSSAVTSVTISNLDGNADVMYRIRARIVNGYGSNYYYLRFNNDTNANYVHQHLQGVNSTAKAFTSGADSKIEFGSGGALGDIQMIDCSIYAKSGYLRTTIDEHTNSIATTVVGEVGLGGGVWNNTVNNITSLLLAPSESNGLGIGTVIELERLNL